MLLKEGIEVLSTSRQYQKLNHKSDIVLDGFNLEISKDFDISLIVNLAGFYSNDISKSSVQKLVDANIGISVALQQILLLKPTPILTIGSYFEKCPIELQPWSFYSLTKIAGFELLKKISKIYNSPLYRVYIYDNYGCLSNRNKFIDQIFQSLDTGQEVNASQGMQKMDLIHVDDLVINLFEIIKKLLLDENVPAETQIRSYETLTLRQIVKMISNASGTPIKINWGANEYAAKETFEIWDSAKNLPNLHLNWNFASFLEEKYK